ncbi:MAG: hypothetical protein WCJ58_01210 [bacterium]
MNKTWITLIAMAIITVLIMIGYEFFLSFTGQKSKFTKPPINQINPDLGIQELNYIKSLEGNVIRKNEQLDAK